MKLAFMCRPVEYSIGNSYSIVTAPFFREFLKPYPALLFLFFVIPLGLIQRWHKSVDHGE